MEASQEEQSSPFQMTLEATNQLQMIEPNNPDENNMLYDQFMDFGQNRYCRGYTQVQINTISAIIWR